MTSGMAVQSIRVVNTTTASRKRGRPKKENKVATTNVNPTTAEEQEVEQVEVQDKFAPVTKTVFDLAKFEDVKLQKPFVAPAKPATLKEALEAVGNDNGKLLELIYDGMCSEARTLQYEDKNDWHKIGEDGKPEESEFSGSYASDDKMKLINGMVLQFAKIQAGGASAWSKLKIEDKNDLRSKAKKMIKDNPAMLASFQG